MASDKDQIIVQVSAGFKESVARYAQSHNVSLTVVVKRAIAEYIGYADIAAELKRAPRTPKYDSVEDAANAETHRRELRSWATKTLTKLMTTDNIELARIIATALANKDYDALDDARDALNNPEPQTETDENE